VERGELDGPLTGAWEAVRWPGNGGEDGGSRKTGAEHAWAQRVASSSPFYRVGGEAGRPDGEGNRAAGGGGINAVKRVESAAPFPGEEGSSERWQRAREVKVAASRAFKGRR
jgi:hypothetical protein